LSDQELPTAQFYPWQQEFQDRFTRQIADQKLPHALLFSGIPDIGKKEFAFALGAQILCDQRLDASCGECSSCHLIKAGTHPDLVVVRPLESRQIKIEQIRDVVDWAAQTAQQGGRKVAIVYPAEQMNQSSGNALLKCLEEPAEGTYFLLVTDQPGRLLPTIRSRCQSVNFPLPSGDKVMRWLKNNTEAGTDVPLLLSLAVGAPLRVNRFDSEYLKRRKAIKACVEKIVMDDPAGIEVAGKLINKEAPPEVYDVLYEVFADALRLGIAETNKYLINKDIEPFINVISEKYSTQKLLNVIRNINFCRKTTGDTTNPNPQLLLESLLIDIASPDRGIA
jgi:DNA polymerase III subunit delta'